MTSFGDDPSSSENFLLLFLIHCLPHNFSRRQVAKSTSESASSVECIICLLRDCSVTNEWCTAKTKSRRCRRRCQRIPDGDQGEVEVQWDFLQFLCASTLDFCNTDKQQNDLVTFQRGRL